MNRQSYEADLFAPIAAVRQSEDKLWRERVVQLNNEYPILTTQEGVQRYVDLPTQISRERVVALQERMRREKLSMAYIEAQALDIENRRFYLCQLTLREMLELTMKGSSLLGSNPNFTECELSGVDFSTSNVVTNKYIANFLELVKKSYIEDAKGHDFVESRLHELATTMIIHHYALAYHALIGKPTYVPSVGLSEALLQTEFRDVPASYLKLPQAAVCIEPPRGVGLHIENKLSGQHEVVSIYVVSRGHENGNAVWHMMIAGEDKERTTTSPQFARNDALLHFAFVIKEGSTVGELLHEHSSMLEKWHAEDMESEGKDDSDIGRVLRFVINTLLYVTLPDAELKTEFRDSRVSKLLSRIEGAPKGSIKRKQLHTEARNLNHDKVILLGSSVKIDRTLRSYDSGAESGTGDRKLYVQHIRRGHWRNQPHGPQRSLHQLRWIKPTYVGPKESPLKITTYDVG